MVVFLLLLSLSGGVVFLSLLSAFFFQWHPLFASAVVSGGASLVLLLRL